LLIPGGALGGIDAISAAREAGLTSVHYVGRKAPSAWKNTPAEELIDLDTVKQAQVFLECDARHAALQFPQNANVVAALALAGLGFDRTRVQLIVDPAARGNAHSFVAHGTFGEISATIQSSTLLSNPKTSVSAPYSLIYSIKRRRSCHHVKDDRSRGRAAAFKKGSETETGATGFPDLRIQKGCRAVCTSPPAGELIRQS
jgi:aspartate dehydrogenase